MVRKTDPNSFAEKASFCLVPERDNITLVLHNMQEKASGSCVKKHYDGHRKRLRQRFIDIGGQGLADYEFLELLLFRSIPRADTKPLAKALLARFGSFADVLGADPQLLQEIPGCGPAVANDLKLVAAAAGRMSQAHLRKRDIFSSWDKLITYCKIVMAHETREQFRILFLDKKNGLIADEVHQTGTVDHTPVYPREVIKRALELSASAIVLVHNHPSGDPSPSRQDIAMTMKLREIAQAMNIIIHDHIIIGRNAYSSFRAMDLL